MTSMTGSASRGRRKGLRLLGHVPSPSERCLPFPGRRLPAETLLLRAPPSPITWPVQKHVAPSPAGVQRACPTCLMNVCVYRHVHMGLANVL